jgi:branched-chain amino acid aminotransferase
MLSTAYFPKAKRYWYMGKFHAWSELTLHPMSHALHYGTCVFEGIRAYPTKKGPAVFLLPEHIDRLLYSAAVAHMTSPYGKDEIIEAVKATIRENKLDICYIRPLLFYSYGNLGLVPKASPVELVIGTWEWGAYLGEKAEKGVAVYILPWRRVHHSQLDMKAKLGGIYMQSTICGLEARAQGADEAVFLNLEGRIAEGPGENIFVIKDGVLKTNERSESILEGLTRTSILEIARDLGYKTSIGPISKEEFCGADEAFFTGTAVEVIPIVKIRDGSDPKGPKRACRIGTGKAGEISLKIRRTFLEIVRGKDPRYKKWLTIVNEK